VLPRCAGIGGGRLREAGGLSVQNVVKLRLIVDSTTNEIVASEKDQL
jgi:hypothetical protein